MRWGAAARLRESVRCSTGGGALAGAGGAMKKETAHGRGLSGGRYPAVCGRHRESQRVGLGGFVSTREARLAVYAADPSKSPAAEGIDSGNPNIFGNGHGALQQREGRGPWEGATLDCHPAVLLC